MNSLERYCIDFGRKNDFSKEGIKFLDYFKYKTNIELKNYLYDRGFELFYENNSLYLSDLDGIKTRLDSVTKFNNLFNEMELDINFELVIK